MMRAKRYQNTSFSLLRSLEFYVFFIFLILGSIIFVFKYFLFISFLVVIYFFIPGYLMLKCIRFKKKYDLIESIIISFGLSLSLILIISYILIKFFSMVLIFPIFLILTSIFNAIIILKKFKFKDLDINKSSNLNLKIKSCNLESFLLKNKYSFLILVLTISFFFLGFFLRRYSIIRYPDEYLYLWASDPDILSNLSYRKYSHMDLHFIVLSTQKVGFLLILSFYFNLAGTTHGIALHIISLFFYSMLIPVTYLLGSLHQKKTGLIAAIFIGCNPIIWFWNNRIMPDILYAVIAVSCFYFFYKSFKERGIIKWNYFIPALIFGLISYTIQPKMIFTWGIASFIFFLSAVKMKGKNEKFLTFLIFGTCILLFLLVLSVFLFASWFFQYDYPNLMENILKVFYFDLQDWYDFVKPDGVIWFCFGYPYYYTYAIIILAFIGIFCFAREHTKRENILFFLSIGMTFYLHSTAYSYYTMRFSFLILPMLLVLAAVGLTKNIGLYSLFLIPFLIIMIFTLSITEPSILRFPAVQAFPSFISKLVAIMIIGYKIFQGTITNKTRLSLKLLPSLHNKLKIYDKELLLIMIILISFSSLNVGNSIVTNDQFWRNDNITDEDLGLPQAGEWLRNNIPHDSIILTNIRAHILSYYMDGEFDIEHNNLRIKRKGIGTIITPSDEEEFQNLIDTHPVDYMVVFTDTLIGEHGRRPYFIPYINEDKLFTIYKLTNESMGLKISESTYGWSKTYGNVNFTLDSSDKKEGLYSVKVNGTTSNNDRTRVLINGNWNIKDVHDLNFWFKLDNATNQYYFSVIFSDNLGNSIYWNNEMEELKYWDSKVWQNIKLRLSKSKGKINDLNKEEVSCISIYAYAAPNTLITYHLDEFQGLVKFKTIHSE